MMSRKYDKGEGLIFNILAKTCNKISSHAPPLLSIKLKHLKSTVINKFEQLSNLNLEVQRNISIQ